MRDGLAGWHPAVSFAYFMSVIVFAMTLFHPVSLAVSITGALLYAVYLSGGKALRFFLLFSLPMICAVTLLNPLISHQGTTILFYLPDGNAYMLESMLRGASSGVMLGAVMLWFSCFHRIITSAHLTYLFGKAFPSLSLILTIALRFVPHFRQQAQTIIAAQDGLRPDKTDRTLAQRIKSGLRVIAVLITWATENAIETADSMRARGYGLPERSSFSLYKFRRRDALLLSVILLLTGGIIFGACLGLGDVAYQPVFTAAGFSPAGALYFAAQAGLCLLPILQALQEEIRWTAIQSEI